MLIFGSQEVQDDMNREIIVEILPLGYEVKWNTKSENRLPLLWKQNNK